MTYKMYLMSIAGLEEECLQQDAMCLLDSYRKEIVHMCKKEKDRMRAIVAGLLLRAGFYEIEPEGLFCRPIDVPDRMEPQTGKTIEGRCYILDCKGFTAYLREYIQENHLLDEISYGKGIHGKPFWTEANWDGAGKNKKLQHFNLSHSGDYAVLIVADKEVGVDIQEARKVKGIQEGYKAFSRMEAFVKCTGEGYACGSKAYEECGGELSGYLFLEFEIVDGYAINACFPC